MVSVSGIPPYTLPRYRKLVLFCLVITSEQDNSVSLGKSLEKSLHRSISLHTLSCRLLLTLVSTGFISLATPSLVSCLHKCQPVEYSKFLYFLKLQELDVIWCASYASFWKYIGKQTHNLCHWLCIKHLKDLCE